MILTISILFLVLTLPYSLFELIRKFLDPKTFNQIIPINKVRIFQRATLLLVDLNHSTNIFFYILTAERFRKQLINLLMFWKKRNSNVEASYSKIDQTVQMTTNNLWVVIFS